MTDWKRKALGQTGGTQGLKDAATRALIPTQLAESLLNYSEGYAYGARRRVCTCHHQLQPHEPMKGVCRG